MIMESNMTMNAQVMYMMMMKVAWQYTQNGYGNAIIGRYGGCFEEGILWVYGTGENCATQERLVMVEG